MRRQLILAAVMALVVVGSGRCQVTVLDDFEGSKGHFNLEPEFSGTSAGMTVTSPGVGPSTTTLDTTTPAFSGASSLQVFIDDDPAVNAPDGTAWRVRLLSGSGTPANNTLIDNTGNTFVGFWLRTTTPGLQTSILLDDGTALERATLQNVIADDQWHLYEWALADATMWDGFAGTGNNGAIDAAQVTIDGAWFTSPLTAGDQDATFNMDSVAFNPSGSLAPIPEPSTLALAGLGGVGLLARRFRRKA